MKKPPQKAYVSDNPLTILKRCIMGQEITQKQRGTLLYSDMSEAQVLNVLANCRAIMQQRQTGSTSLRLVK